MKSNNHKRHHILLYFYCLPYYTILGSLAFFPRHKRALAIMDSRRESERYPYDKAMQVLKLAKMTRLKKKNIGEHPSEKYCPCVKINYPQSSFMYSKKAHFSKVGFV